MVRALLAEGADPLATDYMFRTCLHYAALCNWGPVIDELLGGRHLWRPESSPWQPAGKPPDEATFLKDTMVHDIGGVSRFVVHSARNILRNIPNQVSIACPSWQ